ncbi:phosphate ABC transporter substrate-binding protein PstS [Kitasatospora paracochleata]|uniref:Phosphate-binding protein n=1 Tax=Kitasatospora paracochleata TaxID=58354 RepID=A0ABT1IVJ3_9ACTN|nr:phosphate ABC transporter substrate-binding protein PstS [Kitasatospora paracochleata]MCP2308984.1 phosphate transport system substrate-binding protein [Kitasatospora paracochleata]
MSRRPSPLLRTLSGGAAVLAVLASATGCGSESGTSGTSSPSGEVTAAFVACHGSGQLLGAGSTAQANAMDVWKAAFSSGCPSITVTYGGGGSGAGIQQFNQGKVAFAGSDAALKQSEIDASKQVCTGGQGIDLPMVGGLISVVYNIDGVDHLVLNGQTIAKIFNSEITKWNDPAITALNPGVALPDADIQSVHRSDDSGTTANLTGYLAVASNGTWPYPASKTWAGKGGQSANGSAGVAAQVKQVKNSIGYVELSFAQTNGLKSAAIATGASKPVDATAANAATTIAKAQPAGTGNDLALNLNYATQDEGAYPLVLVTYEIVCDKGNKAATLDALKSFLAYTSSDSAQQAIGSQGYVPLPSAITSQVKNVIPTLS